MTIEEAVALLWPEGPLTQSTLRTAVRDGDLPVARVAGKHFVTRRALAEMAACSRLEAWRPEPD